MLIEAHSRCEEAAGAYRAIDHARRGEPWRPYNAHEETDAFLASVQATRALFGDPPRT